MKMKNKLFFNTKENQGEVFLGEELTYLKHILEKNLIQYRLKRGFRIITTPIIHKKTLFDRSEHTLFFSDNMFFVNDGQEIFKPMSCPAHMLYVKQNFVSSFNRFPIRLFELGRVFRNENSGSLVQMERVKAFTQDDSHILTVTDQQLYDVVFELIHEVCNFYQIIFNLTPEVFISTQPNSTDKTAETILKNVLTAIGIKFGVDENEGAFYGPKIDFKINNIQLSTIQLDLFLTKKFDLKFIDQSTSLTVYPIVIHYALLGSIERFMNLVVSRNNVMPIWCNKTPIVWFGRIEDESIFNSINKMLNSNNQSIRFFEKFDHATVKQYSDHAKYIVFAGENEPAGCISLKDLNDSSIVNLTLNELKNKVASEFEIINFFQDEKKNITI